MPDDALKPARRFLHVCYCCSDGEAVTKFFVDNLALRNTMSTPTERSSGAILGLEGDVLGSAAFLYDARGPRVSPAIEVQTWIEPALVGTPVDDSTKAGIQAIGFTVPDLAAARDRLVAAGCTVTGEGSSPFGFQWVSVRDITGVALDLVEGADVPADETRLRHLRIASTDLGASVPWYEGLGFQVVDTATMDGPSVGREAGSSAEVVRLRLPDEPFEAVLVQWKSPATHGRHVSEPYHAGIYRTAVGVDETRATYEAMTKAGWTFDRAPMSIELTGTPVPDMWICFISDPDGVPFEFVERPRSAFR
jgi:catechol 2,3-dioxygenase-like lactoylglutathione lyase family enzyme